METTNNSNTTNNILVGADPEVFITENGEFKSAHGLIHGTKHEPTRVINGAVQVDGMALEFNIDPARTVEEFLNNIELVYGQLRAQIPQEYEFSDASTAVFDAVYFKQRSLMEKVLGCESDFNAYTLQANPSPNGNVPVRTAGGHVHIGWREPDQIDNDHFKRCADVAKACDVFLGLPSLLYDTDTERRAMYGASGCFRPKEYGVEYRTLSNAWIQSPDRVQHVFENVQNMMSREAEWGDFDYDEVIDCINTSDTQKALELIQMYNIPVIQQKQEAA